MIELRTLVASRLREAKTDAEVTPAAVVTRVLRANGSRARVMAQSRGNFTSLTFFVQEWPVVDSLRDEIVARLRASHPELRVEKWQAPDAEFDDYGHIWLRGQESPEELARHTRRAEREIELRQLRRNCHEITQLLNHLAQDLSSTHSVSLKLNVPKIGIAVKSQDLDLELLKREFPAPYFVAEADLHHDGWISIVTTAKKFAKFLDRFAPRAEDMEDLLR